METQSNLVETYIIRYEGKAVRLVDATSSAHARKHANAILTAERGSYRDVQEALDAGLKIEMAGMLPVKTKG